MSDLIRAENMVPDAPGYGPALAAVNFAARPSTITCLVGPDLWPPKAYLQMLAAIRPPRQGRLKILGFAVDKMDRRARKDLRINTGYVAGDTPLLSVQDGLANVMLPALYHRIAPVGEVRNRAKNLLKRLGCGSDVQVLPSFMTTLERCLVSLARALILKPQILFLEYLFQDLGTEDRISLALVLADIKKTDRLCIVMAVKNLPFVREYADQILFASETKVYCYQSWEAFIESPDPEVRSYLEDEDRA